MHFFEVLFLYHVYFHENRAELYFLAYQREL